MPSANMILFFLLSVTAALRTTPFTPPSDTSSILGQIKEIDQRLIGTFDYDVYMFDSLRVGHMKETIKSGEHQGHPVYQYIDESDFSFGPFKSKEICSSIVATDFTILRSECKEQSTDPDEGETDSITICETSSGKLSCTMTKNKEEPETTTYQLPSGTPYYDEMLAIRVVDLMPGQTLSSVSLDEKEKKLTNIVLSRTGTSRVAAPEGQVDATGIRLYSAEDNESTDFFIHNARILKSTLLDTEGMEMSIIPSSIRIPEPVSSSLMSRDPAALSPRDVTILFIISMMNKDAQKLSELLDFEYMYDEMPDAAISYDEFKTEFTSAIIPGMMQAMEEGDNDLEFINMFPDVNPDVLMEIMLSHTMTEKIQGDMAEVFADENDTDPMRLHKTSQGWKIIF